MWGRRKPDLAKGALAGLAGGHIASFVMNRYQTVVDKLMAKQNGSAGKPDEEPATVKSAASICENVLGRPLPLDEKETAGNAVHYAFGAAAGGVYGALTEEVPEASVCWGTLLGSILWLVADEIAVPAFKLAKPPRSYPLSTHVNALASHLVYGATTDSYGGAFARSK